MKKFYLVIFGAFFLLINGCGIRFADEQLNRPLPDDFVNRDIYPKTDILKYDLNLLVGRLLFCKEDPNESKTFDCLLQLNRIIKDETSPVVKNPEGLVYNSKVDQKASTQGSYLAFTAKFSSEQVAEVTITDSTLIYIKQDDVPMQLLKAYIENNPNDLSTERYWIQGALLATIQRKDLVKIDTNAEGVVGNTTGLKGSVYNSKASVSVDYRISLLLSNIDDEIESLVEPTEFKSIGKGRLIRNIGGIEESMEK